MKVTQITPDLLQLTKASFVNAYLVREQDGFTLVDTTFGGAAEDIVSAARGAGGEIRRIALTHGHTDHAGALDRLAGALGGVEVLMGEADARIHAGEKVLETKPRGNWPKLETAPDVRLTGGERVGSLEVVASPGHTPGHVAFLDSRDRTLIAGDVFTAYGRVEVSARFYWRFPLATMGTTDRPLDIRSARELSALAPSRLLVGHGPAVADPQEAMGEAVRRAGDAEEDLAGGREG
jgi:glyoxylase-like metal-dependent hydrolase (beta-lactamase superfamily II)